MTITPQRDRVVDFSTPYFRANQGVLLARGVAAPKSLAELKALQTCAQVTTTGLDYIKTKLRPSSPPQEYQTTAAALQAVANGRCEALVLDVPIIASAKKQGPTRYGAVGAQIVTNENYGAVFQQGSALRPAINREIKALAANGTIGKLQKKWFGLNFSRIPIIK